MGHSSQRLGKPATRRRTPREYVALKGNFAPDTQDRIMEANLTEGNSNVQSGMDYGSEYH